MSPISPVHVEGESKHRQSEARPPVILLRSSWQTCNIGDIAHTLGVGQLLGQKMPEAELVLWPNELGPDVTKMIQHHLPAMQILDPQDDEQIHAAIDRADLLLHGSAPGIVGLPEIQRWRARTDKPFGLLGVTAQDPDPPTVEVLDQAAFIFTRETTSLDHLARAGCGCPVQRFAPDGVFAMQIQNAAAAEQILQQQGLEPGQFICAVPRLRYSPYHLFKDVNWSEQRIAHVTQVNDRHKMSDHAFLREPIIRWVRETGQRVLVCPEMVYAVDIMDELVIDPLPDDVKPFVSAQREYWLPDAAQAVYEAAACVLSIECHSPIMALAIGRPAFYIRMQEDTIKGQMYRDLGLASWMFEITEDSPAAVAERLLQVGGDSSAASQQIAAMQQRCDQLLGEAVEVIRASCRVR